VLRKVTVTHCNTHRLEYIDPAWIESTSDNDLDCGLDCNTSTYIQNKNGRKLYLVVHSIKKELKNGFLPISFFKYDLQRLELWKMYQQLTKAGLKVIGI